MLSVSVVRPNGQINDNGHFLLYAFVGAILKTIFPLT